MVTVEPPCLALHCRGKVDVYAFYAGPLEAWEGI
jgi:hypothetical protein